MKSLENLLIQHQKKHLFRSRQPIKNTPEINLISIHGKKVINFCSNDYLGISSDPKIKQAYIKGVKKYGFGSGASPHVTGYTKEHHLCEMKFAEYLGRDQAILFNSGYHANIAVLSVLGKIYGKIISDKLCHASILDGIQLSKAKHYRFRHNDFSHLKMLTQQYPESLVVTESVFSMEGSISSLSEIAEITSLNKAFLVVDNAHGIGVLEHTALTQKAVPCLVTPLGKALGGFGAIVSGEKLVIDTLLQFSRTYMYSTALPPAICTGLLEALKIIQKEQWRRENLNHLIDDFTNKAIRYKLPLLSSDSTPIRCFLVGDSEIAHKIQLYLLKKGFGVSCLRPPSVPQNTARIRISLNCFHTTSQVNTLLEHLLDAYRTCF